MTNRPLTTLPTRADHLRAVYLWLLAGLVLAAAFVACLELYGFVYG